MTNTQYFFSHKA